MCLERMDFVVVGLHLLRQGVVNAFVALRNCCKIAISPVGHTEENRMRGARSVVRTLSAPLWVLFLLAYLLAKIDFFRRYFQLRTGDYLREHSVYWAAMAAIAFAIWLIEKRLPHE
jgi:hypothetical protein